MNLTQDVTKIVSEIIGMKPDDINPDALFIQDMGMDSLRAIEILAVIENQYGITIDPERLKEMTTLNNVVKITQEYIDQK